MLANHAFVPADLLDECPEHDSPSRKEYTFGMEEADVITYECGCACCLNREASDPDFAATYHTDYSSAAGRARLIVADSKSKAF